MEIPVIGGDGHVHVAAELGGAVQNARLTSHEQGANPMFPESRKDFANRARGQGSLPRPGRWPTVSGIPRTAAPASMTTIPIFPDLLETRNVPVTAAWANPNGLYRARKLDSTESKSCLRRRWGARLRLDNFPARK